MSITEGITCLFCMACKRADQAVSISRCFPSVVPCYLRDEALRSISIRMKMRPSEQSEIIVYGKEQQQFTHFRNTLFFFIPFYLIAGFSFALLVDSFSCYHKSIVY